MLVWVEMCSTPGTVRLISSISALVNWMRLPGCMPLCGRLVIPLYTQMVLMASLLNSFFNPFSNPLPAPSKIMSMNIPQNTLKAVRNVLSLFLLMELNISSHLSRSNMLLVRKV